jgi:RNA-directed DNA polymerase
MAQAKAVSHNPRGETAASGKRRRSPEEIVSQLQARIVKAREAGEWRRVSRLQYLLAHSRSARELAVERVTTNEGSKTPGVDGETWETPEKKANALEALKRRRYHPKPLKRIYIPKKNGKLRPLGIPVMLDRAEQAVWLLALDPVAEVTADRNSYGFRKERSCADAIEQCFKLLCHRDSAQWVLEGDIKACFDRIDHDWLLKHVPLPREGRDRVAQWLRAGYLESGVLHATEEGSPQGGIVSPVLANLALDGLETLLHEHFDTGSSAVRNKVNLVRYADDFVITGRSKELLEQEVLPLVSAFMAERGLELSAEKTVITHIEDGFDFLGQNVRKYGGKLIIQPSRKNVATFLADIRGIIDANKQATTYRLIRLLNPKITGWTAYHRHICSARTFQEVDRAIFEALWRWAVRRHPDKTRHWVKDRYYMHVPGPFGGNNWQFFGTVTGPDGTAITVRLRRACQTGIRRHVKIKSEVNPYHPRYRTYLAERHARGRKARLGLKTSVALPGAPTRP